MKKSLFVIGFYFILIISLNADVLNWESNYSKSFKRSLNRFRYGILIKKSEYSLYIIKKDLSILKVFPVAIGMNPDGKSKLFAGDHRTPEGLYKINLILSERARRKSINYLKLKEMNEIYFSARDGFFRYNDKTMDLGDNIYGSRFFQLNYPTIKDEKRYNINQKNGKIPKVNGKFRGIGSGIAIHGTNDDSSIGKKATNGCIVLKNTDLVMLDKYIKKGTPLLILP